MTEEELAAIEARLTGPPYGLVEIWEEELRALIAEVRRLREQLRSLSSDFAVMTGIPQPESC